MGFDLNTATDINTTQDAIPTTSFNINTARDIEQPQDTSNNRLFFQNPPKQNFIDSIKSKIGEFFRDSPEENIAKAQNIYAISKVNNIPIQEVEKNIDTLQRDPRMTGIRSDTMTNEEYIAMVSAPVIGQALLVAPAATAIGIAGFTAVDKVFNLNKFVPSDASDTTKTAVQLADYMAKGGIVGGAMAAGEKTAGKMASIFFSRVIDGLEPHFQFQLNPEQIKSLQTTDLPVETKSHLIDTLGINENHIEASLKNDLPIAVPTEKILDVAKQPYWDKVKEIIAPDSEIKPADLQKQYDELQAESKAIVNKENLTPADYERLPHINEQMKNIKEALTSESAQFQSHIDEVSTLETPKDKMRVIEKMKVPDSVKGHLMQHFGLGIFEGVKKVESPKTQESFKIPEFKGNTETDAFAKEIAGDPGKIKAVEDHVSEMKKQREELQKEDAASDKIDPAREKEMARLASQISLAGDVLKVAKIPVEPAINKAIESSKTNQSGLEKTFGMVKKAISEKDTNQLKKILHTGNKQSRKLFEEQTGVKLPRTEGGTDLAIDQWASRNFSSKIEIATVKFKEFNLETKKYKNINSQVKYNLETNTFTNALGVERPMSLEEYKKIKESTIKTAKERGFDLKFSNESGQVQLPKALDEVAKVFHEVGKIVAPREYAPKASVDEVMKLKGAQDKQAFILDRTTKNVQNSFDKLPKEETVAFIDKIKRGEDQPAPELQAVEEMMHQGEDAKYKEVEQYRPGVTWKENHYRVLWKKIPGQPDSKGFLGLFKKPLQGTKGYLKKSSLADMSEGLALGGEPFSYNPIVMWKAHMMDMERFITAQKLWKSYKDLGSRQFVKFGEKAPAGFTKLNDNISKVYFPVEEGMVNAGEWYVEENTARMMNNFLSTDFIRQSALGKGLLEFKNITTSLELSLSPFHGAYVSLTATAQGIGNALSRIFNAKSLGDIASGIVDIAKSGASPAKFAKLGSLGKQYLTKENFVNSPEGKKFLKQFPDAGQLIDDYFFGGGKFGINPDYKTNAVQSFKDGIKNKEFWATTLNALPAANEMLMKPLFDIYIPNLKFGAFLKEYSAELVFRKDQLASGKLTRAELARTVVDSIDNRFGEMNFDNLFWDRNFKTALQILIRSTTWTLGAIKNVSTPLPRQIIELNNAFKEGRRPLLNNDMAYLLGVTTLFSLFGYTTQKLLTGEEPKNFKDIMAPRVDKEGNRVMLNTHLKDWVHLIHDPGKFAQNKMTGEIGRVLETIHNKDFFGTEVYHPDDSMAKKVKDISMHIFPTPFAISNLMQERSKKFPKALQATTALGITQPAPAYVTNSLAQQKAFDILHEKLPAGSRTSVQFERSKMMSQFVSEVKQNKFENVGKALDAGKINEREYNKIISDAGRGPLERTTYNFTGEEVEKVMRVADHKELVQLLPIFEDKMDRKINRAPLDEVEKLEKFKNDVIKFYNKKIGKK